MEHEGTQGVVVMVVVGLEMPDEWRKIDAMETEEGAMQVVVAVVVAVQMIEMLGEALEAVEVATEVELGAMQVADEETMEMLDEGMEAEDEEMLGEVLQAGDGAMMEMLGEGLEVEDEETM